MLLKKFQLRMIVFLTLDDTSCWPGPNSPYTIHLVVRNILQGPKSSFFMIGVLAIFFIRPGTLKRKKLVAIG